ncbi:hypothetical protein LOTGIDRAFT_171571 [Lottia gigantea]|uniref:Copper transport protein n=1 Tax=Lottia gigantea TaxID=225164 RepID=V4BBC6_LOTGI|nr:hypothetical protein LOTGIDRAFT_171571 [Lottia gigantea]ESP03337.1 hypothetical protein LOTGIDRAFT_171571 [Lottia gigantea]
MSSHVNNIDHSTHHIGSHEGHQAFFHTAYGNYMIFYGWVLKDSKSTFLWCIFLAILAIAFQCLKFVRHKLGRKCANLNCRRYILNKNHIVQTFLYVVQFATGYLVMLAVMSYNAWVCTAAIAGLGLGYFFFGWGEFEDGKRREMMILHKKTFDCKIGEGQELEPLSKDVSSDTLLTTVTTNSGGVACSCDVTM